METVVMNSLGKLGGVFILISSRHCLLLSLTLNCPQTRLLAAGYIYTDLAKL